MTNLRTYIRQILSENLEEVKQKKNVAGILIKDVNTDKVFLLKRNDKNPIWAMMTGTIDQGEDPIDALEREMYEELFIKPGSIRINYVGMEHIPTKNMDLYYYEGFVDGAFKPVLDEENLDYGWFSIEDLPSPLYGGIYNRVQELLGKKSEFSDVKRVDENLQLADKTYFTPGRLSPKVREIIVSKITNGDAWTKLICDIYFAMVQNNHAVGDWAIRSLDDKDAEIDRSEKKLENDVMRLEDWKKVKSYYQQLKAYNKNVFPIIGLNPNGVEDIWSLIRALDQRATILEKIKLLPSIALRNMREDIRVPRGGSEMNNYRHNLEYFLSHYSLLDNRDAELKKFVEKKMFKSGMTLEKLLDFVQEKENLLGGKKFDKDVIKDIIENNYHHELEIIYEQGDIMVVEVSGSYGIKDIGCNSLWCFTYGEGYSRNWSQYSYNDTVYVIIDFSESSDSPDFMNVVIKPLVWNPKDEEEEEVNDETVFDMSNTNRYDALHYLDSVIGLDKAKELLTFYVEPEEEEYEEEDDEEENEKEVKEKAFVDPNQLSLFEGKKHTMKEIRKIIRNLIKESLDNEIIHTNVGYKVFNSIVDGINKFGYMKPTGEFEMKGRLEYEKYKVGDMNNEEIVYWGGSVNDTMIYDKNGLFANFLKDNFSKIYNQNTNTHYK